VSRDLFNEDLSFIDVLDEDIERFKSYHIGCVIEGSKLRGLVAIIPDESIDILYRNMTCYLPEEVRYLLSLSEEEAIKVHEMKRKLGGYIRT